VLPRCVGLPPTCILPPPTSFLGALLFFLFRNPTPIFFFRFGMNNLLPFSPLSSYEPEGLFFSFMVTPLTPRHKRDTRSPSSALFPYVDRIARASPRQSIFYETHDLTRNLFPVQPTFHSLFPASTQVRHFPFLPTFSPCRSDTCPFTYDLNQFLFGGSRTKEQRPFLGFPPSLRYNAASTTSPHAFFYSSALPSQVNLNVTHVLPDGGNVVSLPASGLTPLPPSAN